MVQNGIKTGLVPPGGWQAPINLTDGQLVWVTGHSYKDLEANMWKFRLDNMNVLDPGLTDLGRVQSDLHNYFCSTYPSSCASVGADIIHNIAPLAAPQYQSPIRRLESWFGILSVKDTTYTDPATANARSEICGRCPQNIRWVTGCGSCNANITKRALWMNGSRQTSNDSSLLFCRTFGHLNKVAVHLEPTYSEATSSVPDFCWKK